MGAGFGGERIYVYGMAESFHRSSETITTLLTGYTPKQNGLPGWLSSKEAASNAGDPGSIPGSGRSPGGGHGNPLQYSCLENTVDRGAQQATVCKVTGLK